MRRFLKAAPLLSLLLSAGPATAAPATDSVIKDCEQCHGQNGASTHAPIPVIGGMSAFYLEEQVLAYQEGRRPCDASAYPEGPRKGEEVTMCQAVEGLSKDQVSEIAAWFESKPFVPPQQPVNADLAAKGRDIHQAECAKCHSEGGGLAFDDAGILAGQWKGYLKQTLAEYRAGKRWMPEKMAPKIEALSDGDLAALVEFYASQEPVE